jgi:ferredoxin
LRFAKDRRGSDGVRSSHEVIPIDHNKCDGCGLCTPNCPEGALQLTDGKTRLVNDRFSWEGARTGYYQEGAIEIVEREAEVRRRLCS